ncbi:MAG: hypothetical protein ACYCW6_21905 [Candidatus Xenobia bacterium]
MKRHVMAMFAVALLLSMAAMADAKTRIFVDSVEYVGPQLTVDGELYVDAARFATDTGWSVAHADGAVAIAPNDAVVPDGGNGVYVSGQPLNGKTRVQGDTIFVALPDLVAALGGTLKPLPQFHAVRVTGVPGMPNETVLKRQQGRQMVSVDLKTGIEFTLIEYYASW